MVTPATPVHCSSAAVTAGTRSLSLYGRIAAPPSTSSTVPVVQLFSRRKRMAWPMSLGWPARPHGTEEPKPASMPSLTEAGMRDQISVSTRPCRRARNEGKTDRRGRNGAG